MSTVKLMVTASLIEAIDRLDDLRDAATTARVRAQQLAERDGKESEWWELSRKIEVLREKLYDQEVDDVLVLLVKEASRLA